MTTFTEKECKRMTESRAELEYWRDKRSGNVNDATIGAAFSEALDQHTSEMRRHRGLCRKYH